MTVYEFWLSLFAGLVLVIAVSGGSFAVAMRVRRMESAIKDHQRAIETAKWEEAREAINAVREDNALLRARSAEQDARISEQNALLTRMRWRIATLTNVLKENGIPVPPDPLDDATPNPPPDPVLMMNDAELRRWMTTADYAGGANISREEAQTIMFDLGWPTDAISASSRGKFFALMIQYANANGQRGELVDALRAIRPFRVVPE